jgi:hypothetical protein
MPERAKAALSGPLQNEHKHSVQATDFKPLREGNIFHNCSISPSRKTVRRQLFFPVNVNYFSRAGAVIDLRFFVMERVP